MDGWVVYRYMQYDTCKNSIEIEFQVGPEWITATVQDTAQLKQFLCVIYNMQLIEGVIPSILKKSIVQKHSIHVIHRIFTSHATATRCTQYYFGDYHMNWWA